MKISRVGMDLAKQVFEVCGVDRRGKVRLRKTLRRARVLEFFAQLEPCANAAVPASETAKLALPANHDVSTPDATGKGAPVTLAVARSKGTDSGRGSPGSEIRIEGGVRSGFAPRPSVMPERQYSL